MDGNYLSIDEIFFLILLVITLTIPFKLLNPKNRISFAHPLVFFSIIMIYYTVLSPSFQIAFNATSNRGFDFRDQYILGWKGALLSAISVLIGYSLKAKIRNKATKYCDLNYQSLWTIGVSLNIFGFSIFMVSQGFDLSVLNPFYNISMSYDFLTYQGSFRNYFKHAQEILVAGNFLIFASAFSTQKKMALSFAIILISTGFYLNSGFRYRLFFLFSSIILFLITKENKYKINTVFNISIFSLIFIIFFMTYVGQIRTYGTGFDLSSLNLTGDFLKNIFTEAESSVFITTSGLLNIIPEKYPFQNFYPIFKALIHPLPGDLFDKNAGDYLFKAVNMVYGFRNIYHGAAYLNFGEYYLMFGWFGIFIFNFLLGYFFKKLWFWINLHKEEPLALLVYFLNVSFTFMIISRGYLPQQLHLYLFTVFPVNLIYFYNLKPKFNSESAK